MSVCWSCAFCVNGERESGSFWKKPRASPGLRVLSAVPADARWVWFPCAELPGVGRFAGGGNTSALLAHGAEVTAVRHAEAPSATAGLVWGQKKFPSLAQTTEKGIFNGSVDTT